MRDRPPNDLNPIGDHLADLPSVLYKYRSFDPQGFGLDMACNGTAFFSSARQFNDPFDCYFIPTTKAGGMSDFELKQYVAEKTRQHFPHATRNERRRLNRAAVLRHKRRMSGSLDGLLDVVEHQYDSMGILSLVEPPLSLPMWAYYGDEHKGLCVGLKTELLAEHQMRLLKEGQLLMLYRVVYQNKVPECNVDFESSTSTTDDLDAIARTFCTKSDQWRHEEEVRLIFWSRPDSIHEFGSDSIAEIIIGMRAPEKDAEALIKRVESSGMETVVKRAKRLSYEFGVDFDVVFDSTTA